MNIIKYKNLLKFIQIKMSNSILIKNIDVIRIRIVNP